jgi:parvulin-like peptidyl-prolyl isomerase
MSLRNRFHSTGKFLGAAFDCMAILLLTFMSVSAQENALTVQSAHTVREALVVVNADTIFTSDLDSALIRFHANINEEERKQFDYRKLLNKLVNDHLIIQEAVNLGMDKEDWLVDQMEKIRRDNAVRRYLADNYKPNLDISESEILDYFLKNYDKMQIRTVAVRTIEEAQNLIAAIKRGASMDSIANATSLDTYRFRGGLHSIMHKASIEEVLRNQALKLKPGELSPPFHYEQAYAFLRLELFQPADTAEMPIFKRIITEILQSRKNEAAWNIFIKNLGTMFPVTTDSTAWAKLLSDSGKLYTQDFVKSSDAVIFRVNDKNKIMDEEFRTMLSKAAMSARNQSFDSILDNVSPRARDQIVLSAAADKAGYWHDPLVVAACKKSLDSMLLEAYLEETIVSQIKFSRTEFEAYYKKNPDRFREPEQFLIDRMAVKDSAMAQEVGKRLADGADFEYLARQYGTDVKVVNAEQEEGWASLAKFPSSVAADIGKLEIGRASKPYPTTEGWMFFRIKGRRAGKLKPLENVETEIREIIFQSKFDDALDKVLNTLKAGATIKYNEKAITKYFGQE